MISSEVIGRVIVDDQIGRIHISKPSAPNAVPILFIAIEVPSC